ncbi:MAG TPA: hypothetical protein DCM08_10940 [Microscillaceae bacterium]|jgi:predicted membrane-bound spermidine synthase|nr:hypothetical protein [Microscillaceae bacterium]
MIPSHPFIRLLYKLWSYLWGIVLARYPSAFSGELEVWYINGRKMLFSPQANYSFGTLHQVFQAAFRTLALTTWQPQRVLLLGLGGGSVVHILQKEWKLDCHICAVELDPVVITIAREHFEMDAFGDALQIVEADAVAFVQQCADQFDLVVVDLFIDTEVPVAIQTSTFIQACGALVAAGGKLLCNMMTDTPAKKQQLANFSQLFEAMPEGRLRVLAWREVNRVLIWEKFIFR